MAIRIDNPSKNAESPMADSIQCADAHRLPRPRRIFVPAITPVAHVPPPGPVGTNDASLARRTPHVRYWANVGGNCWELADGGQTSRGRWQMAMHIEDLSMILRRCVDGGGFGILGFSGMPILTTMPGGWLTREAPRSAIPGISSTRIQTDS
jgi:hypothetical protein